MEKAQSIIEKMGTGTLDVFRQNNSLWSGKVALSRKVDQLEQNLVNITLLDSLTTPSTNGYAAHKNEVKRLMSNAAYLIASPLLIFAREKRNTVLVQEIDFTFTALAQAQDKLSRNRCQLVNDRAQTYLADLPDYDITADQLTALQQLIHNFDDLLALPRAVRKSQQNIRTDLKAAFKTLAQTLDDLDRLMVPFTISNPAFYQAYANARLIGRERSRTVSVQGRVTDSVTASPLANVEIYVLEIDKKSTSGTKGTFRFLSLTSGNFTLQVSREGYLSQTISQVAILDGKTLHQDIALVKA
jgi:hypothetical protein